MNKIKQINQINQKELASSTTTYKSSWHYDYRDTNYIFINNIPTSIKAHDLVIIFSQYGIPTHLNLVHSREGVDDGNQQHRGFAFLKYANFKSCILAIDNFNGIKIGDRLLVVDHCYYKLRHGEKEDDYLINYDEVRKQLEEEGRGGEEEKGQVKLIEDGNESEVKPNRAQLEDPKEKEGEDVSKSVDDDEFADPIETVQENAIAVEKEEEDEFVDPMQQFITEASNESKEKKHKLHRSSKHRSHRSHRSDEKSSHRKH